MNIFRTCLPVLFLFMLSGCTQSAPEKPFLLLADREAPLGWLYLRVYQDSTFELESRGLRKSRIFSGTAGFRGDTIRFQYDGDIPAAGSIALISGGTLFYLDGEYNERMPICYLELPSDGPPPAVTASLRQDSNEFVAYDQPALAIVHALLIDGSGGPPREDQTILLENGRIVSVRDSEEVPEGYEVFNANGMTVIPGLIGTHNHMHMPGIPFLGRAGAALYLAAGVTTIQTCGSASPEEELAFSRLIDQGEEIGPQIIPSAPYITGPGGNPNMIIPENESQLRDTMRYWTNRGVHWFKVYRHITPGHLAVVIDEARLREARVTGHLCSVTFTEAVQLGIDGIEHGLNSAADFRSGKDPGVCNGGRAYMDELDLSGPEVTGLLKAMVRQGVHMNSTLSIYESGIPARARPDARSLAVMSPSLAARFNTPPPDDPEESALRLRRLQRIMRFERRFVELGGLLGSGCDPGRHVLPGFGDQRNFELLRQAGFSVPEAIRIMTRNGARILQLEDRGMIVPGQNADLVILEGDLRSDDAVIRTADVVFRNGVGFDTGNMLRMLRGKLGGQEE